MRLGLYGGSFDPVHCGHLLVARAALEELALDRLDFLPAARSPYKPAAAPADPSARLRWLRLALAGQVDCRVDDREIRRGAPSYTIDTVREVGAEHPDAELFWLVGADQLAGLPGWRESRELARRIRFVVVPRPGAQPGIEPEGFRLLHLSGWPLAVSSSEIRARLAAGRTIGHLVPPAVAEALVREGAYRDPAPEFR